MTIERDEMTEKIQNLAVAEGMERFDTAAMFLFNKLLAVFPTPIELNVNMAVAEHDWTGYEDLEDEAGYGLFSEACAAIAHTMTFLESEGIVSYASNDEWLGSEHPSSFLEVRLTLKGLSIIRGVPISLRDSTEPQTIFDILKRQSGKIGERAAGSALGGLLSSLGSRYVGS